MSISDKIAIASLIVTVITLGIAIYALFTWKKQLKYNLIFDLEDKFNILIGDFIEEFEFNALIQYKIIKITSTDKKVIKELTEKLTEEYKKFQDDKFHKHIWYEYSLSLSKVERVFPKFTKKCEYLQYNYLHELFQDLLKIRKLDEETIDKENNLTKEAMDIKNKIKIVTEEGNKFLSEYRKSLQRVYNIAP